MDNCYFCLGNIPKGKYLPFIKVSKKFCSTKCYNKTLALRRGILNNKYMPKGLDNIDKAFIERMLKENITKVEVNSGR